LLMADVWSAEEAHAAGLVNKVVPIADLDTRGEEWAERIARLPRDGIAIGRAATTIALQSLGIHAQFSYGHVLHTRRSTRWIAQVRKEKPGVIALS